MSDTAVDEASFSPDAVFEYARTYRRGDTSDDGPEPSQGRATDNAEE